MSRLGRSGAVAWSAGKTAFAQAKDDARIRSAFDRRRLGLPAERLPACASPTTTAPRSGFRIAKEATPELLEWKGSHLGATVSPDGRFLVTTMQEPMLHGWRLADRKHMRMSGYASRVTSMSWTADGDWLATSGAPQLILWPFQGKDGPMGKEPRVLAPAEHRVEVVACHPKDPIVAVGYADGMVLFVRIEDGAEILVRKPGDAPVSALAWSAGRHVCLPSARKTAKPAYSISPDRPERDTRWLDRHPALAFCLSMIFSENRIPLFRIML